MDKIFLIIYENNFSFSIRNAVEPIIRDPTSNFFPFGSRKVKEKNATKEGK